MKQLIEFPIDENESIWIEVETSEDEYGDEEVSCEDLPGKATRTFHEALSTVTPVAEAIIGKLSKLNENLKEIDVEFGLKMNAKAGAVVASSGIEANFKVALKWKRE